MSSTRYGSGSAAIVRGMHQYWTGRIGQSRAGGGVPVSGITPEGKAGVVDVQEGEGGREGASFEMTILFTRHMVGRTCPPSRVARAEMMNHLTGSSGIRVHELDFRGSDEPQDVEVWRGPWNVRMKVLDA